MIRRRLAFGCFWLIALFAVLIVIVIACGGNGKKTAPASPSGNSSAIPVVSLPVIGKFTPPATHPAARHATVKPSARAEATTRAPAAAVPSKAPAPVTVTTKAAPASCHPLSNSGHCYEPGEFCRAGDHGLSGVAGDGAAITCRDNNGWRWED